MKGYQNSLKEVIKNALIENAVKKHKEPITLSSGLKSDVFIDCTNVLSQLKIYKAIIKLISFSIAKEADYIGGPATGAIPLACGASLERTYLGFLTGWFYTKKPNIFCGNMKSGKAVIVEDVITSGQSVINSIETAQENGLNVIQVLSLVDREIGGLEKIKEKVPNTTSFFTLSNLIGKNNDY